MTQPFQPEEHGWSSVRTAGFFTTIGPLWCRQVGDSWEYGLVIEKQHENPLGISHGGMLMTLMDQAMSIVAWHQAERQPCATIQLDTHFLAPSKAGDFLVARIDVTRKSASLIFLRGVLSVAEREIMTAQGLMKIVRRSTD